MQNLKAMAVMDGHGHGDGNFWPNKPNLAMKALAPEQSR
jgi:hypothetical protein